MAQSDAARLGLRELTEEEAAGKRRTKLEDYDPTPGTYQKRTVVSQVRDKHGNVIEDHLNPGLKPQDDTGYVQTTKFKGGGKYEMATLEMRQETKIDAATVRRLVKRAVALNSELGNPQAAAPKKTTSSRRQARSTGNASAKRVSKGSVKRRG